MDIQFYVPAGMNPELLAQKFTALLVEVYREHTDKHPDYGNGPFRMQANSDKSWRLDVTNNYWLHIYEEGKANLQSRYSREEGSVAERVMALFKVQLAQQ